MESESPRICVPVCEQTIAAVEQAITSASQVADVIEIRLDCIDPFQVEEAFSHAGRWCENSPKPIILTYRPAEQGGRRELKVGERLSFWIFRRPDTNAFFDIELPFASNPSMFDYRIAPDWSRVICSHHDMVGVPADLDGLYEEMVRTPAQILKIAVQADDAVDCLGLFRLLERAQLEKRQLIPIAMGIGGIATRILGPSRGAFLTYAAMDNDKATAQGQLTVRELKQTYRIEKLRRNTEIYGVVGSPIAHSLSPYIHNAAFEATETSAVYIPFEVRNLGAFMQRMVHPRTREMDWNMRGLSVTAPHKTSVMDQLDWIEPSAKRIGAVNTIVVDGEGLCGYNTDASAVVRVLTEKLGSVARARVAVIGSGGVARAALDGFRAAKAKSTVFARDAEKGSRVAASFDAGFQRLTDATFEGFDVVINATPLGTRGELEADSPATASQLRGARLAYDLVYNPSETRFLREAREAGCETLGGLSTLVAQAAEQFRLWTGREAPEEVMKEAARFEI